MYMLIHIVALQKMAIICLANLLQNLFHLTSRNVIFQNILWKNYTSLSYALGQNMFNSLT